MCAKNYLLVFVAHGHLPSLSGLSGHPQAVLSHVLDTHSPPPLVHMYWAHRSVPVSALANATLVNASVSTNNAEPNATDKLAPKSNIFFFITFSFRFGVTITDAEFLATHQKLQQRRFHCQLIRLHKRRCQQNRSDHESQHCPTPIGTDLWIGILRGLIFCDGQHCGNASRLLCQFWFTPFQFYFPQL